MCLQVSGQVLNDHVLNIITQLVQNFVEMAGTFTFNKVAPIKYLNSDLRALVLVTQARPELASPPGLLKALEALESKSKALLQPLDKGQGLSGAEKDISTATTR